jgi:single-strand DNA-binding protein
MPDASVSFAGNLTDDPEVRRTDGGVARATLRVAVSGRRDTEASFFTVVVGRDQAEHAAEDGSTRSVVEVVAEELGPSLRWATATTTRATRSSDR